MPGEYGVESLFPVSQWDLVNSDANENKPRNPMRSREETTSSCMGLRRVLNDIITSNFDCHTYSSSARLKPLRDQDYNSLRDCCAPSAILARHPQHFMPLDFGNVRHNEIGQAYAHQFCAPQSDR